MLLVLSDCPIAQDRLPIHALLATGAVHHRLVRDGLRCDINLVVHTATARDPHHIAACSATAPLWSIPTWPTTCCAISCAAAKSSTAIIRPWWRTTARASARGLYKIISKMGISTINSYRGAQLFEIVGLARRGGGSVFHTTSRIQGAGFGDLEADQAELARRAWKRRLPIEPGGLLKYMHGGEYHAYNPDVVQTLQQAVASGDYADYRTFAQLVNERPVATLRDLLRLKPATQPIPLDEVESIETILPRFDSAGMSLGALSPEAHETLAEAMNPAWAVVPTPARGRDPARCGTVKMSKIKQVASGRFRRHPAYLVNADHCKSRSPRAPKPGEAASCPAIRSAPPSPACVSLAPACAPISPPPHHDIYHRRSGATDLRPQTDQPQALVSLVAEAGESALSPARVAKGLRRPDHHFRLRRRHRRLAAHLGQNTPVARQGTGSERDPSDPAP